MSIQSFPFTSVNGDRRVTAAQFRKFWAGFASNGVLGRYLNRCACTKNGMNIVIGTGAALINGAMAVLEATESVAITASSSARYATVVLEFNDNSAYRSISAKVIYGSSSAEATLTQNETVYQLPLCSILVPANATSLAPSVLYDRRTYSSAVDYVLPVATASALGGVKPVAKTSDMTQQVGVDSEGLLWTPPGSSGSGMVGKGVFYGSCLNSGTDRAKEVTCGSGFTLRQGVVVNVYFQTPQNYDATDAAPFTLNVDDTGAKDVLRFGSTAAPKGAWRAGEVVSFVYSGSVWYMLNGSALRMGDSGDGVSY